MSDPLSSVRMTHPDRVLYPALGLTKRALAEYYVGIAEWILPHLAGRPTSLVRCPDGLAGKCFYQKHGGTRAPPELRRVTVPERRKVSDCLVVDDEEGLVALAQMSILEIHTWNCQADALEQPDRLVFDLDPAEDVPWSRIVAAALCVRRHLEARGLVSFVKTTGGKGLHVVAPIAVGPSWRQAFTFAEAAAEALAAAHPDEFLLDGAKAKRPGRIYIDYPRNQRGATSVCAYSTRARPDAPVSTPLRWDELDPAVRTVFTLAEVKARLASLGADPWQEYHGLAQGLPSD